ncbi:polyprenyl synthetase family protein [Botrimarina mediterranea]|uniref:Octaprenyl-diphosphate synthase n=1 Tax=Botrimarina mediterranea TaxID=2528022 RepID=A0A518K640_9BACT|nr:polyprenyl synthetase family protein [Botrimarina mediterranea]QDV73263.1 Octaprenyl-diphosphate synthase [Botrimarina mediterranea]
MDSSTTTSVNTAATRPPSAVVADLFGPILPALRRVEDRLQSELTSSDPLVDEVVRHGYRLGGKRLRPALVLLVGNAVGELTSAHELLGVVVEMIHTATLVHDDVLDEAQLRRHVDTVNARWGNEKSVLLGDFLFSQAFYLAATVDRDAATACQLIGRTTNRVCHGELRQTLAEGDLGLSQADYFDIIDGKTAELCACCCRLGAVYAGASSEVADAMESYGRNLGMAFQIADDLLDLTGDEATTGKTTGADLAKQKMTLPLIYTRDSLVNGPRLALEEWLKDPSSKSRAEVAKLVEAVGGFAFAQKTAIEYANRAVADLAVLEESELKHSLATLAFFASRRDA